MSPANIIIRMGKLKNKVQKYTGKKIWTTIDNINIECQWASVVRNKGLDDLLCSDNTNKAFYLGNYFIM